MSRIKRTLRAAFLAGIIAFPTSLWAQEYFNPPPAVQSAIPQVPPDINYADLPPPIDWATRTHTVPQHEPRTDCEAYDVVGSHLACPSPPNGRPMYPYNAPCDWWAHDAAPESWGDLAELPYVQLGWFCSADLSIYRARALGQFRSHTLLDATFPGDPINLGASRLDGSLSPRIELGYRYERGLGEIRFGYQYYGFDGNDTLAGYDPGGLAARSTSVRGHTFDLDFAYLEFNSEGLPFPIHPLFKWPGRIGLGRRLTPGWFATPLEMRIGLGARGANYYTDVTAAGPTTTDTVMSNFWGGGLHFTWDLNQQIREDVPLFWHLRAEGSGVWGVIDQSFTRTRGGLTGVGVEPRRWIGVPTVSLEAGLSWSPRLPNRNLRLTTAYHYEQWFCYGQDTESTADLCLNGVLMRAELKY